MEEQKYYTTSEFMKLTHVTKKTLRYYNDHDILKPAVVTDKGNRLYTDKELALMQQILLLKFLGFSLGNIKEMTINNSNAKFMTDSLRLQLRLVQDRIEQMQLVATAIEDTTKALEEEKNVDWSQMRELVELTGMENSLQKQYQNASNISARINLHKLFSQNQKGWFPWVYEQCKKAKNIKMSCGTDSESMRIMELGCGDGSFWLQNIDSLPKDCEIVVSDVSKGMVRDARRVLGKHKDFIFKVIDAEDIPYNDETFELVIANHVLFYCDDIAAACKEISRVLKPGGVFICSAYGSKHMSEITTLVKKFDDRITLSGQNLYDNFGRENGEKMLSPFFSVVDWETYEDSLLVTEAEPLISYILSCHGNQNQFILDKYNDFQSYVKKQIGEDGYHISKDAGVFICRR